MNNAEYWVNSDIGTEHISYLLPNLGPLLKLLSTEFKADLGDRLAKCFAYKTTSCEILTVYAVQKLVNTLIDKMDPSSQSRLQRNNKPGTSRLARGNVPQAALQAFENRAPVINLKDVSDILPGKEMLTIFLGHENKVWFRVILVILFCCPTGGDPPRRDRFSILQDEQKIKLLKAYMAHHIDKKVEQSAGKKGLKPKKTNLSQEIKKALGGNKVHPCKIALHDLFYYLSTCSKDIEGVCKALGPALFTPLDTRHFSKYLQTLKGKGNLLREITTKLMLFMVNNINNIFLSRNRPYERDIDTAIHSLSPTDFGRVKQTRLKQHLRHFFEIRDPICKRIVVPLFDYFEFQDIAIGILAKYRLLPYGWREEVESNIGNLPIDFFDLPSSKNKSTGNDYLKINGSYYDEQSNEKNNKQPSKEVIQKMTRNGTHSFLTKYLNKNEIKYLSEKTTFWNDITATKIYAPAATNPSVIDLVIDEFINKQRKLLAALKNFTSFYVSEVEAISKGNLGPEAQKALCISSSDVRTIFKNNFEEVTTAQEKFVTMLEPLLLCKDAPIKQQYASLGRAGVLFRLFKECKKTIITGFQNYNVNYTVKTETLQRLQSEALRIGDDVGEGVSEHCTFVKLWEEISTTKTSLTSKKLETVLYLPVQAPPQYKIFFERLLKKLGPTYEHQDVALEAIKVAEDISIALDKNMKRAQGFQQ